MLLGGDVAAGLSRRQRVPQCLGDALTGTVPGLECPQCTSLAPVPPHLHPFSVPSQEHGAFPPCSQALGSVGVRPGGSPGHRVCRARWLCPVGRCPLLGSEHPADITFGSYPPRNAPQATARCSGWGSRLCACRHTTLHPTNTGRVVAGDPPGDNAGQWGMQWDGASSCHCLVVFSGCRGPLSARSRSGTPLGFGIQTSGWGVGIFSLLSLLIRFKVPLPLA